MEHSRIPEDMGASLPGKPGHPPVNTVLGGIGILENCFDISIRKQNIEHFGEVGVEVETDSIFAFPLLIEGSSSPA